MDPETLVLRDLLDCSAVKVLVVGAGTAGLAAARDLANRGASVTVLERFGHVHEHGSHGGYTRAIRHAYHEGSNYVPMVREADRAWVELEERHGISLLVRAGLLEFGSADHPGYRSAIEACEVHGIEHERLTPADARRRWPFEIPPDWEACFTPSGGYLRVKACLDVLRSEATRSGAKFRYQSRVTGLALDGSRPAVILQDGRLEADSVVVAVGARLPSLLPELLPGKLHALRRVLVWLRPPEHELETMARLPVWGAFVREGFFYGFPWNDEGIEGLKLACHASDAIEGLDRPVDPDALDRSLTRADLEPLTDFVQRYLPRAHGPLAGHRVCLYTATPSWNFLIDRHPDHGRVVIIGGLSGHGFKFAPALGKRVTAMLLDGAEAPPEFRLRTHQG